MNTVRDEDFLRKLRTKQARCKHKWGPWRQPHSLTPLRWCQDCGGLGTRYPENTKARKEQEQFND